MQQSSKLRKGEKREERKESFSQRLIFMLRRLPGMAKKGVCSFYRFTYLVGLQSVRMLKHGGRRVKKFLRPVGILFQRFFFWAVGKRLLQVKKECVSIRRTCQTSKQKFRTAKKYGGGAMFREFFRLSGRGLVQHKKVFSTIINIAAPVAAIFVLVFTIQHWTSQKYALALEYNGETLGYVSDEGVFDEATDMVSARMSGSDNALVDTAVPKFTLSAVDDVKYVTASNVCDKIITSTNGVIEEATGLYVDGEYVASASSGTDLKFMLQTILKEYAVEEETEDVEFTKDVQLIDGYYPSDNIQSAEDIKRILTGKSEVEEYYTIQEGDTAFAVAMEHNMSYEDLEKLNPDMKPELLQNGQKIKIASAKTFLAVQVVKEVTYTEPIAYETIKEESSSYTQGTQKVTVQGKNGEKQVTDKVVYVDGVEVSRENISETVITEPVDKKILIGTKKKVTASYSRPATGGSSGGSQSVSGSTQPSTGSFMFPVAFSQGISRRYGYSYGSFHGAVDFMAPAGTAVYAADAGVVTSAYWDSGYGWCMAIRHDNGMVTFYAHCNRLYVNAGVRVSKGQTIAAVGSTGSWSTGNHLHFEVRVNGIKKNPLNYL